jgi:hypothetical protein
MCKPDRIGITIFYFGVGVVFMGVRWIFRLLIFCFWVFWLCFCLLEVASWARTQSKGLNL